LVISQKDRWLVVRLQTLFGGSIYTAREKYRGGQYLIHRWYLNGARGRGFAYTIYPWLSPRRREQIRKALGIEISVEAVA
jgi:hypothetical protein